MKRFIICLIAFALLAGGGVCKAQSNRTNVFTVVYATSSDGFLNVRSEPSMKGKVLTKLWTASHGLGHGVLLEKRHKWSKVSVDDIEGWVYNKYLGSMLWYTGEGKTFLVAKLPQTPIYGENYADDPAGYPLFTKVQRGTIIADDYDQIEGYYILKTGHDYLFIRKSDVEVRQR